MLRAKEISSRELFAEFWERYEARNPLLNAIVQVDPDRALAGCLQADEAVAHGEWLGPLHGLPMTIKDAIPVDGMVATGGAEELRDYIPSADAPAVGRLRTAGAVIYGKTNVPRWSADLQTFNAIYGTTNNPWDLDRTPGGSSGGAAAAVAAGMTAFELGTDIGGSVRIPASFCGVFSHKPSFGVIPQHGYLGHLGAGAALSDINVFGPIARSVDDLELALDVLAGPDDHEARGWVLRLPSARQTKLEQFRLGAWLDDPLCEVDVEIAGLLAGVVNTLVADGADVRFSPPPIDLGDSYELFVSLVRAAISRSVELEPGRMLGGWHVDWIANHEKRAELRDRWRDYFTEHDILLCPVTPMAAFPHDQSKPPTERAVMINGRERRLVSSLHWLGAASVAYLPATVIPVGRTAANLPVGLQVVGPYLDDRTTLAAAAEISRRLAGFVPPPLEEI